MCNRCMYLRDGDTGVDWQPIFPDYRRKRSRAIEHSPHWVAIRGLDVDLSENPRWFKQEPIVYVEGGCYTDHELEVIADQMLRAQAKVVDIKTGKERGIGGKDPILFREHLDARKRREIYNENGIPEPHLVSGLYNRTHPQGRKVNTPEQRAKHGAAYYRG